MPGPTLHTQQMAVVRLLLGMAQIGCATVTLVTWFFGGPLLLVGVLAIVTLGLVAASRWWFRGR